jgi:UDP-GlcNAc:undecaprenyl-phosphate GlcNAc-1-phosphate transferase
MEKMSFPFSNPFYYLIPFGITFCLSLFLTPIVRHFSIRLDLTDKPKSDRWHKKPTPILGGSAIFLGLLIASLFYYHHLDHRLLIFIGASSLMFLLGLIDDLIHLKPPTKLIGQIIGASILVNYNFVLNWTKIPAIDSFFTILWVVGITNAFNLLDNMDGLSAGVALIASFFCFLVNWIDQNSMLCLLVALFGGSILGFLIYNFNPASIFMGDSGSLFIGFFISGLSIMGGGGHSSNLISILVIPTFILLIPIFDMIFVTLVRRISGRAITQGGKDHTSHRLVSIGFSERKAVIILYGLSFLSGGIAFWIKRYESLWLIIIVPLFLIFLMFLAIYLEKVKVYEEDREELLGKRDGITSFIIDFTHRRRIFEIILDLVLVILAYFASYFLRFEGEVLEGNIPLFQKSLPIVIVCFLSSFFIFGVYKGVWRYTGIRDLITHIKAVSFGSIASVIAILYLYRFAYFSRTVFVINALILLIFLSGSRLSFRLFSNISGSQSNNGRNIVIYGAGDGGELTLREIMNNRALDMKVVGFIDDNPRLLSKTIHGFKVLGGIDELDKILREFEVSEVVISFKNLNGHRIERIKEICSQNNVRLKSMAMTFLDIK